MPANIRTIAALAALALAGAAATAHADAKPAWAGVWHGTIGSSTVQVCLQHTDYEDFGAYYYMRHLQIISLGKLDGKDAVWTEAANSDQAAKGPLWRVTSIKNGQLTGTWTGNGKSLPIALSAVTVKNDDNEDQPCGSDAFNLPRFTKPVVTTKPAKVDGIAYSRVLVDIGKQFSDSGFETFQLAGTTPAIRRINAELYKDLPKDAAHAGYFQCAQAALAQNGLDGSMSSTLSPETLTKSFMVTADAEEGDCGGAHPNADTGYQTWDLRTGTKIDLNGLFAKGALTQTVHDKGTANEYTDVAFTPPFKAMILKALPAPDPDCKEALETADTWSPRLTASGMAFTPDLAHVDAGCTDDAVIPFVKLAPYLTPEGKALVSAFAAEAKGRK